MDDREKCRILDLVRLDSRDRELGRVIDCYKLTKSYTGSSVISPQIQESSFY